MFGIDESNVITYVPDGEPAGSMAVWETKAQFAAAVSKAGWSKADVTAIWNVNVKAGVFAGADTMKRFRNRQYGVGRIWEAMQALKGGGEAKAVAVATNGKPKRAAAHSRAAPTNGKPKKTAVERKPRVPRDGRRREAVIELLKRDTGVSRKELQEAFGWEPHSARGFLSTLASKHGVKIETTKDADRGRVYRVV